jgi:hypothetical protein
VQLGASSGGDVFALTPHATETLNASGTTADTFVFQPNFGQVALSGFAIDADALELQIGDFSYLTAGMSQAADLAALIANSAIVQSGSNTILSDSFGDKLILNGIAASTLEAHPAAFMFK